MSANEKLFETPQLGRLPLKNRIAVAPMTRTSANGDGTVGPSMRDYYAAFAEGGYGLVITEGTFPDLAFSQGYRNQPGIASQAQADSWRPVVEAVHAAGARIIVQLMHAGALSQFNAYSGGTVGPSEIQPRGEQMSIYAGSGLYRRPRAITAAEIADVVSTFAQSAQRARDVGFDGIEIHGANGYLLDQFLTRYTNSRTDRYGGDTKARIRLTAEVASAVKKQVGDALTVGVRISQGKVNDFHHKWEEGEADAAIVFAELARTDIDYIHTTEFEAGAPAFGQGPSLASLAKRHAKLPVVANGSLHDPDAADRLISEGHADVVALGRGALSNADWPARLRAGEPLRPFDSAILQPLATIDNARAVIAAQAASPVIAG